MIAAPAAALLVRATRAAWRRFPAPLRKQLEDRVFYAIFQSTRVTNDAYGWRPPPPPGEAPAEGAAPPGPPR